MPPSRTSFIRLRWNLHFGMNNGEKIPNKRRSKEEGHMAQLIRRKMTQRDHGDNSKFTRKEKHKKDYGA